jgi:hypothetical protein
MVMKIRVRKTVQIKMKNTKHWKPNWIRLIRSLMKK